MVILYYMVINKKQFFTISINQLFLKSCLFEKVIKLKLGVVMTKKVSILALVGILALTGIVFAQKYKVDISKVQDGTYKGTHESSYLGIKGSTEANVTVAGGKITKIDLVKAPHRKIQKAAPAAFEMMISKNDVEADAKTMATLKGVVYNALTKK